MGIELNHGTPVWDEFIERLSGEDGCNFRADPKAKSEKNPKGTVWDCGDPETKDRFALTKKVFKAMKIDEAQGFAAINKVGHACCDCEIVFNMDR